MRHLTLVALLALAACGAPASAPPAGAPGPAASAEVSAAPAPAPSAAREVRIVFLGDSLTAGYGLPADQAYPALLEQRLRAEGVAVRVVNAGSSGDTTAGGLAKLGWLLKQSPDVLVVALGANDGLRGQPPETSEQALRDIVTQGRAAGARVLLVGMRVPESMGPDYARAFEAVFPRVAADMGVPLVPFLLEGVALVPELNLPDGIHPTAEGQARLAANVLPHLRPLVQAASAGAR